MTPSAEPVVSFADTLREQDKIFYTAFPQALSDDCTCDLDSFDFTPTQDDHNSKFQKFYDCCLTHTNQILSSPLPWFGNHRTSSALYGHAKSSISPLTSHAIAIPGASLHPEVQGNPSVSGHTTGVNTDQPLTAQSQQISRELAIYQDERLPCDKRPIRSKLSRHNADRKPILACLFCRGRKIACGPPVAGIGEKTCRQCHRRSLTCVYPSESRRGMRKKKDECNIRNTVDPEVVTLVR